MFWFICSKMPLTNAERQRMFRMRRNSDPEKRAEHLLKKKEKYKDDIIKRKRKKVCDMNKRDLRKQRAEWRKRQQLCRSRLKTADTVQEDENFVSSTTSVSSATASTRRRRRVQGNKSALYRENMHLHTELVKCKRAAERYKKRCSRLIRSQTSSSNIDTPRRGTEALLKSGNRDNIRKMLVFHKVLINQIKEKYSSAQTPKHRRTVLGTVTGQIIKKYRQMKALTSQIGITSKMRKAVHHSKPNFSLPIIRKTYTDIRSFYERDDVSRICAGIQGHSFSAWRKKAKATDE
jgi:hypothetical protein